MTRRLLLLALTLLLTACTLPYSRFKGKEAAYYWDPSPPRLLFSLQPPPAEDRLLSIALSANGNHLALATDHGTIQLWNIRYRHEEHELHTQKRFVSALAFSSDDRTLLAASDQPDSGGFSTNTPLTLEAYDTNTTNLTATATDHGLHPIFRFDPSGRFLAVTTEQANFFLHRLPSLAAITPPISRDLYSVYRTRTQPAFFLPSSDHTLRILASGALWQVELEPPASDATPPSAHPRELATYPDQPDALGSPGDPNYFAELPTASEFSLPPFYFKRAFAGITVSSLDRNTITHFISPDKEQFIDRIFTIPPSKSFPAGRLLVGSYQGVMLIDLARRRFQWLHYDPLDIWGTGHRTEQVTLSADQTKAAACGSWGAAVWQISEN